MSMPVHLSWNPTYRLTLQILAVLMYVTGRFTLIYTVSQLSSWHAPGAEVSTSPKSQSV